MKRLLLCSLLVVLSCTSLMEAQTVRINRIAMSPGQRIGVSGPNYISTGLKVFAKGMKVYWTADTVTGTAPTFTWSLVSAPSGSTATVGVYHADTVALLADMVGQYIVQAQLPGGITANDTVFASTYLGWVPGSTSMGCQLCHANQANTYAKTNHATVFMRGITGQLEVDSTGKGAYAKSCVRCHTTGYEPTADNGNFGFIANTTHFDSTWWQGLPVAGGDFWIVWKDQTILNNLMTNYPTLVPVASIGCESCHGAGKDHNGDATKIDVGYTAGVCLQCHDAPKNHSIGYFFKKSSHMNMPLSGEESGRSSCWPCHNGAALAAVQKNPTSPDFKSIPAVASISCQGCHDPHDNTNPFQLRVAQAQPLMNKFVIPAGVGGTGQLCMVCHRTRYDGPAKVAAQSRIFTDRYYAHYSEQTDMFWGTNAYEFGQNLTGLNTHTGLENACVTCHMAERAYPGTTGVRPNHQFTMAEDNGGPDIVTACVSCHGDIKSFDEIKAMQDYDGNGTIEGVQTEITNIMAKLKAKLPLDANGEVVTMKADSAKVQAMVTSTSDPKYVAILGAMYNYWFVKNDFSKGVHNTKYTVAILQASLAALAGPSDVTPLDQKIPGSFTLGQNYPNPFNPSTTINFSVPRSGDVTLQVFNSAGQLVTTLANGYMMPGNYAATWNAVNVNSGTYFYRLTVASNGSQLASFTKKMVVMK